MPFRISLHVDAIFSESPFSIIEGAIDQLLQFFDMQGVELKNLRPRNQRAIHIEEWVISRRTDQPEISALHIRQKNVLLRFVEMMNLVHEQNGFCLLYTSPSP